MGYFSKRQSCSSHVKLLAGQKSEQLACTYLKQQGLRFMARNFRVKIGEIDLIMRDNDTIVFIEVRYRRSQQFGGALQSIDWRKQQRIIHTAQWFLLRHDNLVNWPCRFDVVTLSGKIEAPEICWLKNAFQ